MRIPFFIYSLTNLAYTDTKKGAPLDSETFVNLKSNTFSFASGNLEG